MGIVSENDKQYLLSLKPEDLTLGNMVSMLGDLRDNDADPTVAKIKKSRFNTVDTMTLMPSEYFVKEKTNTTVGKFIYNKYIVEKLGLQEVLGYVNWELTDSGNAKLEAILSEALLTDKITTETYANYINERDNLEMQMHYVLTVSITMNILKTPEKVKNEKARLLKEHEAELKAGDIGVASQVEKELLDIARKEIKDDVGMELYDSGARGSFPNHYKNINLLKGPILNPQTGKYDFLSSCLLDGIKKEEVPAFANAVVTGEYPKSVGTQVSGYKAKQLQAALQAEVLDVEGSDCGTNEYIEVELTSKNANDFKNRYIIVGSKLVELTPENMSKYIGQTVKMRSVMMCIGDKLCHHCTGNLFYKLGIVNIGLTSSKVATSLTKLGMKKFHDNTIKTQKINLDNIFID